MDDTSLHAVSEASRIRRTDAACFDFRMRDEVIARPSTKITQKDTWIEDNVLECLFPRRIQRHMQCLTLICNVPILISTPVIPPVYIQQQESSRCVISMASHRNLTSPRRLAVNAEVRGVAGTKVSLCASPHSSKHELGPIAV